VERTYTSFTKLNDGWNADPGAPYPEVRIEERTLVLSFYLNPWVFPGFKRGDVGELIFSDCWRYRLGPTNDEGWWRGQCRFSRRAPDWGEFYEVAGDLRLERLPGDAWTLIAEEAKTETRHFLFYLKDDTFECDATGWTFKALPTTGNPSASWETVSLPSGSSVQLVPPRSRPKLITGPSVQMRPNESCRGSAVRFLRRLRNRLL
jgi:hypothetical protein